MGLKPYTGGYEPLPQLNLRPYDGDYSPVTGGVGMQKADDPGIFEEFAAKFRAGLGRTKDWIDAAFGDLMPDAPDSVARGLGYEDSADQQRTQRAIEMAQEERDFQARDRTSASTERGLQEISQAETMLDATKAAVRNPRAVVMTGAQSLGMTAPAMVAGAASGVAAPATVGAGSAFVEYQSTLRDVLAEAGVDMTDVSQVRRALENEALMAKAKEKAATRGVAIGTFDALTAGVAGRIVAASRGIPSATGRALGELGVQAGGGGAGEAVAQGLTGEYKPGDIVMEMIAEVPTAITEVPTNYGRAREAFKQRAADRDMVHGDYRSLAEQFGATITSTTRSPDKNRRVGGVPNSQHVSGTAADFVVPDGQADEFMRRAREMGYEVVDERKRTRGTGPHIHLELPSGKAGRATLEGRRAARRQAVERGEMSPASATFEDKLDEAREARGVPLEPTRKTPAPKSMDELASGASAPSAPEAPQMPGRRVSQVVEDLKNQMLDQATQQAFTPPPLDATPANVPGLSAEQPAPVSAPPQSVANQPAPMAPAAPDMQGAPQAPAPVEQQTPPVATPAEQQMAPPAQPIEAQPPPMAQPAPEQPAAPTPPVRPEEGVLTPPHRPGAPTDWVIAERLNTPESNAIAGMLSGGALAGMPKVEPGSVFEVKLEPKQQQLIERMGRVLGRKIVLFSTDQRNPVTGFTVRGDSKRIYVNVGEVQRGYAMTAIIGHEFTHTLRTQGSSMLEDLISYARKQVNTQNSYVKDMVIAYSRSYGGRGYSREQMTDAIMEELVADFIGDLINDERFWAELAQKDQSLFKRLLGGLIRYLSKMMDRARKISDEQAFRDIEGMRAKATAMMREYLRDPSAGANFKPQPAAQPAPKPKAAPKGKRPVKDVIVDGQSMLEQFQMTRPGSAENIVAYYLINAKGNAEAALRNLKKRGAPGADQAEIDRAIEMLEGIAFLDSEQPGYIVSGDGSQAPMASLGADYRRDLVRERAQTMAAHHFENGNYMDAAREVEKITDEHAPPMQIDTPEKKAFFKDSSRKVNLKDLAAIYFHGTAFDITKFDPATGDASFLAEKSHFSAPYSAAAMAKKAKTAGPDVIVDGQSMQALMAQSKKGTADYALAEVLLRAKGDTDAALIELADYVYVSDTTYDVAYLDGETLAEAQERLEQLAFVANEQPGFIRTEKREFGSGMQVIPLVTNVKNPWDFREKSHVKRLVEAMRDEFRVPSAMSEKMHQRMNFKDWDHVQRSLEGGSWPLLEDKGAGIPKLIRELGYDAYFVAEDGYTNLAVFDPRNIKSAYGNVGSFGQRPPTAEEAASLGMTLEEAINAQQWGDIRLSLGRTMATTFTNGLYTHENRAQLERWLLDEFRDVREIQKAIADNYFAGQLPSDMNAHRRENLRHGAFQDKAKRAEQRFIEPISKLITSVNGADLDGFSRYLWWRHAGERDAYLRSHADPNLNIAPDGLAGIDPAVAAQNIAALDPQVRAAYERAAEHIDRMRNFTLKTLLDSGQITRDRFDALMNQYQHYVPLRGMPDGSDQLNGRGQGRGLSMNQNPIGPRAEGRQTEPSNIIEEMMRDLELALIGEQKQAVFDSLVRMIAVHPDPDLWSVQPVKAERKWVNGVLTVVQTNGEPENQITFMHRGIPVKIEIKHEGMRKALLNIQEPMPKWLRSAGRVTRWLSAIKTSFSPYFLLINPVRDVSFALMAVASEHGMDTVKKMAEFYASSYGALKLDDSTGGAAMRVLQSKGASAHRMKAQQYAREFSAIGGKTGYTYVNDIREQQRKLRNMVARHAQSKGMKDIMAGNFTTKDAGLLARKAQQRVANLFEVANDMAENSTRLAVYSALREQGKSIEEAGAYAKEVTVNFNRRGSFSKVLGGFYMFFNAAMQGGARMGRLMKNPKFAAAIGGLITVSYTVALAQMVAAGDDDDGESNYDKAISDSQAQRSLGIYLGGGKSIALPVPYGPNIATYLGYRAAKFTYDQMRGRNPSSGKAAGDIIMQAAMSMSPVDPGRGLGAFLPEMARVPYQALNNRSDFGGKLNNKLMGTRDEKMLPLADKTDARTGAPYRWMAEGLNTISGGTDYRGGAINLTGEQTRYVAEQFGGGLLRLATETWQLVENKLAGIDPEPSDIPLANVYFRGRGDRRHAGPYYENADDFDRSVLQWRKAVEAEDEDAIQAILKRAPWIEGAELSASTREGREAQAGTVMEAKRDTDREIRKLRKEQEAIRADKELDWRERKRLLRQIDVEISEYQKDFNAAINAGRGVRSMQGSQ